MRSRNSGMLALASRHCAAHQCENAISLLESCFARQPGDAGLSHQIGLCYSGACRTHPLVSRSLAIAYFERALEIVGTRGPAELRARCLDSLGNALRGSSQPTLALPLLEEAAAIFGRLGFAGEFARIEFNLGNLACDLAVAGAPSQWQAAIRHYRNALTVRREDVDPLHFAATVQNLGTAYRELPAGDRAANLRQAIACYYAAFRVYSASHMHAKRADLHNNLGNAFSQLPPPIASSRNIRRALRHFALALRVRTKSDRPCDYAVTQFNRAQVYLRLADCDPSGSVRSALDCFQEALEGFVLCGDQPRAEIVRHCLKDILP